MSSNENPIIEDSPELLKSLDEFENERSTLLVKTFHSTIKNQLKDPDKQFILLVNSDISFKKYKSVWSNNPEQLEKLFVELQEREDLKDPVPDTNIIDSKDLPIVVPIYTAEASDYYTDPETGKQFFAESIFNYDNNNYWLSQSDQPKELKIIFQKDERVKFIVIDFFESAKKQYTFEIGYNTGDRDQNGKPIYRYLRDNQNSDKRLEITTELKDSLQFIEFDNPIFSNEILLNFTSNEAGINYLFVIKNDLSKEAIEEFLQLNTKP